jgi:two-component system response regulator QseB
MVSMKALVLDDDAKMARFVAQVLREEGYTVDLCATGADALRLAELGVYELMVLDWMVPDVDGLSVCRELRRRGVVTSILMLSARGQVSEKVLGLETGADDYLVKPFDLDELAARIRALLRRRSGRSEPQLEHLGVALEPATHRVTHGGVEVPLSPREFALLQLLMERPGAILSRAQIEERLYGWGEEVESNAVEVHIHGLRRKLGAQFILTVRGVGYRLRPQA